MRFAYHDLGEQRAGTTVTVRLHGSAANVILLDPANFSRYRAGRPFNYAGGRFLRSPAELEIPQDGRWFVVVDLGGYRGRVRGSVSVQPGGAPAEPHGSLVEA